MAVEWTEFYGQWKSMPEAMKAKAESTKVEMDRDLSESFHAFYWLSEQRHISSGMGGSYPSFIPLSEIKTYHEVFKPSMDLVHFVRVIRAADRAFCKFQAKKSKEKAESRKLRKVGR